jgi:hypothetical protein
VILRLFRHGLLYIAAVIIWCIVLEKLLTGRWIP